MTMISAPNFKYRDFLNSNTAPPARHRFKTKARAKAMAEETDARIERLEKESQESRAQMIEMMELIRTLVRDKESASGPNPQNQTAQPDQRREDVVYPPGYTPPYAPNVHMTQAPSMQQAEGFPYGYEIGRAHV